MDCPRTGGPKTAAIKENKLDVLQAVIKNPRNRKKAC